MAPARARALAPTLLLCSSSPDAGRTCTTSRASSLSLEAISTPTCARRARRSKAPSRAASCTRTAISTPESWANNPGDYMPFPVTAELLARGQQRYDIYCAPCHSRIGDGNGVIPSRGFPRKPPSFHIERLRKAPLGYFFDVITNGFGSMPDYASQIDAARPLGHRGLHPRPAVEPGGHCRRRSRGTEGPVRTAALRRTRFGRNLACDRQPSPHTVLRKRSRNDHGSHAPTST